MINYAGNQPDLISRRTRIGVRPGNPNHEGISMDHNPSRWHTAPVCARRLCAAGILLLAAGATGCVSWNGGSTPKPPSFSVTASPSTLDIPAGGSGYSVVSITRRDGFTGAVTFAVTGLPAGVVASGSIPADASTGYLTVAVDPDVAPQSWSALAVDGKAGSLDFGTSFSLTVVAPLPESTLPTSLVSAPGGYQSGGNGTLTNFGVLMEPVAHVLASNVSGNLDNEAGFLPDADPALP